MTNKTNFIGWSGKTEFTKLDLTKVNLSGSTQSGPSKLSSITESPIDFNQNREKNSKINRDLKVPPTPSPKSEANPVFTEGKKLGIAPTFKLSSNLESVSVPFTAGTIDTSFPSGDNTGFNGDVWDSKVQSDGKVIVVGNFTRYDYDGGSYYAPYLIRLNPDGSPDFTFKYTFDAWDIGFYLNGLVYTVEIQSDGKILVGGDFSWYYADTSWYSPRIIRFNSDGSYDNTFFIGDGFDSTVRKILVQPDNKILVAGGFSSFNGSQYDPNNGPAYWRIARLNSNGTADLTFNSGKGIDWDDYGFVYDIVLQPDGKIILGGDFNNYNNHSVNYIVRVNSDGSYDNTFLQGVGFNDTVYSLSLQSDGKIIVGGYFNDYDNNNLFGGYIVRLGADGQLDTRFDNGFNDVVRKITIQSDDKILIGGDMTLFYSNDGNFDIDQIVRFNSDCTLDFSFFSVDTLNNSVYSVTLNTDNKIYVGGKFNYGAPYLLNRFGRLNNSITGYKYVYFFISCTNALQNEPVTYVVGSNTFLDISKTYSLQNLNNPSIIDCGFIKTLPTSNIISHVVVNEYNDCAEAYSANTKLVGIKDCITGENNFAFVDNKYQVGDILYIDWLIDTTSFNWGNSGYFKFAAIIMDELPFNSLPPFWNSFPIVPYAPYSSCDDAINANGTHYVAISCNEMEATFPLIHKTYYDSVSILEPTGTNPVKVIADYIPYGPADYITGGTPTIYSTVEFDSNTFNYDVLCDIGLTSVSPIGIPKSNFYSYFNGMIYTTVELPDGKILVGGNFDNYDGYNVGGIARLNSDGTLDTTFNENNDGFNRYVKAITIQPDGKILVGGDFDYYNGEFAGKIIRLNSDGSIDQDFTYSSEFDGIVRAIAVQKDGKIVVGGGFNYYYDFYCPRIVRLNSDGTPDRTFVMGDGFDGNVYTINVESIRNTPFYVTNGPITYTENIIVGGWFNNYNSYRSGGIIKLSPNGEVLSDFGHGFNQDTGSRPRVNQILKQTDGKLIIIGGADGGYLRDFNEDYIPQNIVRLERNRFGLYEIDPTFVTRYWSDNGGFGGGALSITELPNGKFMVGGQFNRYNDNSNEYNSTGYLVRLNNDGSLDTTFTYVLDDNYVNKVRLLSSGKLLVGGWFRNPSNYLAQIYIGEEYKLHSFNTCEGETSNIYVPSNMSISSGSNTGNVFTATSITYEEISTSGLDLAYDGNYDDSNFYIELPVPFDVNFLGTNYTTVNVSSNPYITFGQGGNPGDCCFDIPNEIPTGPSLPGVYLSFACPNEIANYDGQMYQLYTGLTDNGNTMVIKFIGSDHCDEIATLVYGFKFYKDKSDYFDLVIESNTQFFNDDPTGGVSDGVNPTWFTTFDSSPLTAYRIGFDSSTIIKGNVNETSSVCGNLGGIIETPQLGGGSTGGSMYFDGHANGIVQVDNGGGQFGFNGTNDFTIEWFQYWEGGSNSRPFSIGVYNDPKEMIGMSFEGTVYLWINNTAYNSGIINDDIINGWHHIAITRYYNGVDHAWRVFLDGIQKTSLIDNTDTTNTYTLTLGNQLNNDGIFTGYITNFRVNNLSALYTSDFTVPTEPLTCGPGNIILLMTSTDETSLLTDSCGGQTITSTGTTWSTNTPFINSNDFTLYTVTDNTTYETCEDCGQLYNTILYVRDGVNPNKVQYNTMSKTSIDNVQSLGPIFTLRGPECYEILKYYK